MAYNVQDIVNELPTNGTYNTRPISNITDIVIHHSAADPKFGPRDFAEWHTQENGWPAIGYHYVIMADGAIYQTNYHDTNSYQTGGHNSYTLGICLAGNFEKDEVPKKQLDALIWLIKRLKRQLPNINEIHPHGHYKGTSCPGRNMPMSEIRRRANIEVRVNVLALVIAVILFLGSIGLIAYLKLT